MKMPQDMYAALKRDFCLVAHAAAKAKGSFTMNMRAAWDIFHRVGQERSYDGAIRGQLETMSGIPCSVAYVHGYRAGSVYDNLNDSHIETALKRILSE